MRRRRLPLVLLVAAAIAVAGAGGFALGRAGADSRPGYTDRVVGELLRMERRKAAVPHGNDQRFADLLPLRQGRGFPLVVVAHVADAAPSYGYGRVEQTCEAPADSATSCAGVSEYRAIATTDARAETVVIDADIEVDEVLAADDGADRDEVPSHLHVQWLVAGPASASPPDPVETADALRALGPIVWVLTPPGSNTTYGRYEPDPLLVSVAWPPFGMALVRDGGRLRPVAGPIPAALDTLPELRHALRRS